MRKSLLALVCASMLVPVAPVSAETVREMAPQRHGRLQLDTMPLGQLVTILMRDVMRVPYVIQPDVVADRRPMSIDIRFDRSEMPLPIVRFLRGIGLAVRIEGGTVYVAKRDLAGNNVSGSPQLSESGGIGRAPVGEWQGNAPSAPVGYAPPIQNSSAGPAEPYRPAFAAAVPTNRAVAVVVPAYRSTAELGQALEAIFPDMRISSRAAERAGDGRIRGTADPERMVITSDAETIALAEAVVRELDRPRAQVKLHAVVFEVRQSQVKGSALQLLANVLGGKVQAGYGGQQSGGDFLKIAVGGVSAVLSATREDGRFQIVAEPSLVASSGSVAELKSGSQVPTLGAVTFSDDGKPIRSIEYRDSGISLAVTPQVRGGEIELDLVQERSSFARTNTGVDETPTLNRSTSSSRFALAPGETVVVAGLEERSEDQTNSGFLGGLLKSKSRQSGNAQLLVVVQADLAPDARSGETVFEVLKATTQGEGA